MMRLWALLGLPICIIDLKYNLHRQILNADYQNWYRHTCGATSMPVQDPALYCSKTQHGTAHDTLQKLQYRNCTLKMGSESWSFRVPLIQQHAVYMTDFSSGVRRPNDRNYGCKNT